MNIIVNGSEREALQLKLKRQSAFDIIRGVKKLVVYPFKERYRDKILDEANYTEWIRNGFPADHKPLFKKKIRYIHFTDHTNDWFLNVWVKQHFIEFLTASNIRVLGEEFNFHDLDYLIERLERLKDDDELDNVFAFEIGKVIETNLRPPIIVNRYLVRTYNPSTL